MPLFGCACLSTPAVAALSTALVGVGDSVRGVRWEELFADLEAQALAEERVELEVEVADRTRRESARLRLVDRLRGAAASGREISVTTRGGDPVTGQVGGVGPDWLLLEAAGAEVLVSLAAVETVSGLGPESAAPGSEGLVAARLGLGHALRAIARDRAEVRLSTVGGLTVVGTLERVGQDHVELSEHPAGEPRLRGQRRLVPHLAIGTVRTLG